MSELPLPTPTHSGVIPFRRTAAGVEVLLVTSSTQRRWVCPKGHLEPDLTARGSAAKEAYEEAGIQGYVHPRPLGVYRHQTRSGGNVVELYAMEVMRVLPEWPEEHIRQRHWFTLAEAAEKMVEEDLRSLLRALPARLTGPAPPERPAGS